MSDEYDLDIAVAGMTEEELSEVLGEDGVELDSVAATALKSLIAQCGGLEGALRAISLLDQKEAA